MTLEKNKVSRSVILFFKIPTERSFLLKNFLEQAAAT